MRGKASKFAIIMGVVGAIGVALGAKTQEDTSKAPPPPKPCNEAMYAHYDLFTKDEEKSFHFGAHSACQKYSGYERWVELSSVGFNQDQTVAVVHFIDGGGHPRNFHSLIGATGKDRML